MNSPAVIPLAQANDVSLVGGKAFALGKMIRDGYQVPPGFVISAEAFEKMTPELEKAILQHFKDLKATYVAVRSSAINEDGQADAWAGQLDTFLNTTRAGLIHNVKRCWESAQSTRAQAYASQKSIEIGAVAVIIQAMIQSQVSGVAFSVHPILQDTDKVIIEAGLGLGEAVVSGQVTPDTYITSKQTNQIVEKHISKQTEQITQDGWQDLEQAGGLQKLSDQQIVELATIICRLEKYFGFPVDVEWGLYDNKFYILQSRPITNLAN